MSMIGAITASETWAFRIPWGSIKGFSFSDKSFQA
jgi:hypothetical protein